MYDIENSIGFLLSKSYQRGFGLFREQLDPHGITPPQFSLLAFLWKEDGLSQVELSERTQIDRTTLCGLIDRLEKAGVVERRPNPVDRRSYRICLTARGKELEKPLSEIASKTVERFSSDLTPADRKELVRLLLILRGERRVYEPVHC